MTKINYIFLTIFAALLIPAATQGQAPTSSEPPILEHMVKDKDEDERLMILEWLREREEITADIQRLEDNLKRLKKLHRTVKETENNTIKKRSQLLAIANEIKKTLDQIDAKVRDYNASVPVVRRPFDEDTLQLWERILKKNNGIDSSDQRSAPICGKQFRIYNRTENPISVTYSYFDTTRKYPMQGKSGLEVKPAICDSYIHLSDSSQKRVKVHPEQTYEIVHQDRKIAIQLVVNH